MMLIPYWLWTTHPGNLRTWNKPYLTDDERWMQEIAGLVGELYELLAEMRYVKPGAIQYPSYLGPKINTTLAKAWGVSADAIRLLRILPYAVQTPGPFRNPVTKEPIMSATAWQAWRYKDELLLSTAFADMRDDGILIRSRIRGGAIGLMMRTLNICIKMSC